MNRDDIIKMAQEAGCYDDGEEFCFVNFRHIERFVELVAAYEREECAKLCDRHAADFSVFDRQPYESMESGAAGCAAAIRARGEK